MPNRSAATAGMNSMNGKYFLTLSIRNPFTP